MSSPPPISFSLISLITMRPEKRTPILFQNQTGVYQLTWEEATQVVKNVFDVVLGVALEDSQMKKSKPELKPVPIKPQEPNQSQNQKPIEKEKATKGPKAEPKELLKEAKAEPKELSKEAKELSQEAKELSKATKLKGSKDWTESTKAKIPTCFTCGELGHVSKMCSWYKTELCSFITTPKGCMFGSKCRQAHDPYEIRVFCRLCGLTHNVDQHVFDEEEEETTCKGCGNTGHAYKECPERYCRTCKNQAHWSSDCFKCGQCGDVSHISMNCPYMKKFTANKFA